MKLPESLLLASAFPHPVEHLEVIDTHISWIILTGEFAYKIKKPVNFGFLDFTTLAQRQHFCEEELRLNQRLAPDIYLSVVGIGGDDKTPLFGATEHITEYAVKMRQFNPANRLDLLQDDRRFETLWIDELAKQIADFHQRIPLSAPDSPYGNSDLIRNVVRDNFLQIPKEALNEGQARTLQAQLDATDKSLEQLQALLHERKEQGFIRECHGDLHLANISLFKKKLRLFDCIEFSLPFRWIDTISDLAFLLMDLEANKRDRWAYRCLNLYLELSGDYRGVPLLRFYKSYRSMVRAKVAMLGSSPDMETFERYLALTQSYHTPPSPKLFLMHGISGSGKSYISHKLAEQVGAIRIRSDVERKRLYHQLCLSGETLPLYGPEMNQRTFRHLFETTRMLLNAGYPVIVDATFIRQGSRQNYFELASQLDVPIHIISCHCPLSLIKARLKRRKAEGIDASDADIAVMQQQRQYSQPLTDDELNHTLSLNTDDDDAINRLLEEFSVEGTG